jgi:hypothetical protein
MHHTRQSDIYHKPLGGMMELEDPFDYQKPKWLVLEEREKRRAARAKRLGRPIGTWGGNRKGAGERYKKPYDSKVFIKHTRIQHSLLLDLGNGDLNAGVQKLIDTKLDEL